MSRRKPSLIIALVLVCISLVIAYALSHNNVGESSAVPPQNNPTETQTPETSETPLFVIPENLLGILGLLLASAAALGIFAAAKKRKYFRL